MKAGWTEVALGEVATVDRQVVEPGEITAGTLYVGLENVLSGGGLRDVAPVAEGQIASGKFMFDSGHVLFGKLRPNLAKSARPAFAGVCSTDILPVRPGVTLDRDYLAHFIASPDTVALATQRAAGANLPRLSPKQLELFRLPLPPLVEQRRVARVLDMAGALCAKRHQSLADLEAMASSVFIAMFGDPVSNPRGWPTAKLGDLGTLERGVSKHRPRNAPELLGGPYPLIQTGDVARSRGVITRYSSTYSDAGLKQSRLWPAGTLCITIAANIAMTGVMMFDACFPDSVVGLTSDPQMTGYVQTWLSFLQPTLERSAPESAQKNINLAILRDLPVPRPPTDALKEFGKRRKAIDAANQRHDAHLSHLDALFASLQHRAFTGTL